MIKAIFLDLSTPNKIGRVFNLFLSKLTSLISNGIVIATIKENLPIIDKIISKLTVKLFSKTVRRIVEKHQEAAIIYIFKYGISRNLIEYNKDSNERPKTKKMDLILKL